MKIWNKLKKNFAESLWMCLALAEVGESNVEIICPQRQKLFFNNKNHNNKMERKSIWITITTIPREHPNCLKEEKSKRKLSEEKNHLFDEHLPLNQLLLNSWMRILGFLFSAGIFVCLASTLPSLSLFLPTTLPNPIGDCILWVTCWVTILRYNWHISYL